MSAANFIADLAANGRYHFTTGEASAALGSSVVASRAALRRLKSKGQIATPYRGFFVIVPPEYYRLGCLPADQFIPQLMAYLGTPYYVALLSAASYHGAAHQRPQVFQVMVPKNRPRISCGEVRVRFMARRNVGDIPTTNFNTPRGFVRVSSPEATAFDLVGYPGEAGGIDNVATVLAELRERICSEELVSVAKRSPVTWAQRLGYLMDLTGDGEGTQLLAEYVNEVAQDTCPLMTGGPVKGVPLSPRWKLAVNADVEPDV